MWSQHLETHIMSVTTQSHLANVMAREIEGLRKNWFWLLILGIALVIVGCLAIGSSFIATLTTVIVLGILFLAGGIVDIVSAFWAHCWRGFWLSLLAGILYVVLGFLLIQHPVAMAAGFTLVLAAAFMVGGLFRIISALVDHFHGWGWILLNGVVTLVLGIMIWRQWPDSALWVIGLFVGIDMVFAGWSWIMMALAVRSVPTPTVTT
jgi:uncharacterized membrane protein HdeD (DUF308 family)